MIEINIPNMTALQRRMLDALWRMDNLTEVEDWIRSQPTTALQREAETMKQLLMCAVFDAEQSTDLAKAALDKIFR